MHDQKRNKGRLHIGEGFFKRTQLTFTKTYRRRDVRQWANFVASRGIEIKCGGYVSLVSFAVLCGQNHCRKYLNISQLFGTGKDYSDGFFTGVYNLDGCGPD